MALPASHGGPRDPADECVHCGFCLPACPTYASWGLEADSPRGRIDLYRAQRAGEIGLDALAGPFDRCLGCLACTTACPSGVRYGEIVEDARARLERERPRPRADRWRRRLLFALLPYPSRLRLAAALLALARAMGLAWLARRPLARLAPGLAAMEALAPRVGVRELLARLPRRVAAAGERRLRVGLVAGCVQRVFLPGVNAATARVLAAEGCEVVVPPGQGCCGALSQHVGRTEEARRLARAIVAAFEAAGVDLVAVNAAGCGSHLKQLGRVLADDPAWAARAAAFAARVRDATEIVAALPPRAGRRPLQARVAYHAACHLAHGQGVHQAPRDVLRAIPGLTVVEVGDDACCGSAGVHNLLEPASAEEIGRRKVERLLATGAELVASPNPGCSLHLARLLRAQGRGGPAIVHPMELVDRSMRGEAPPRPTPPRGSRG